MTSEWKFDREACQHFFELDDDKSVKVYKTTAGDYALTIHSDEAGQGGEVDYFDTLKNAKRHGEKIADGKEADPDGNRV